MPIALVLQNSQVRMFHTHPDLFWRRDELCCEDWRTVERKRLERGQGIAHTLINKIDVTISAAPITDRRNLSRQRFTRPQKLGELHHGEVHKKWFTETSV